MGVGIRQLEADNSSVSEASRSVAFGRELRHAVSLIRGTSHRLSLFCIHADRGADRRLAGIVQSQFDREAQVDVTRADDGRLVFWLMFIRTGGGDRVLEARVQATLIAALAGGNGDVVDLSIQAIHRDARTTSDFDDLIDELRAVRTETPAGIFH